MLNKLIGWLKSLGDRLSRETTLLIEFGGLFLAGYVVYRWYNAPPILLVPHSLFAVFALLPGVLGLVNHFASVLPRYRATRDTVIDYQKFCEGFDEWWRTIGWPRKLALAGVHDGANDFARTEKRRPSDDDILSFRPMTAAAVWASLILSTVFMIAAWVATDRDALLGHFPQVQLPAAVDGANRAELDDNATNGFLFAALGAFVSVMWRMINRINANALTSRFMFTSSLRSAIAMMMGLAAGQFDLFAFLQADGPKQSLFFLIGLFTDWALSSLRARARTVFQLPDSACDRLPLCYVDGLDDGVIDILDEIGIWDIEHLATSEPGELAIRTLYPFNRINDWIDQAILISYLRRDIVHARKLGITSAIDLALTFSYTLGEQSEPRRQNAAAVLDELAKNAGMSRSALDLMCLHLWFDYTIEQLYRFWQHHREVWESRDAQPGLA